MRPDASVAADPAAGFVRVGGTRITMTAADAAGAWRFGGPAGPVLRPLCFGERTELVTAASTEPRPRAAVASAVLGASMIEPGGGDRMMLEVLALWLAGAAWEAPEFAETALLVGRTAGWPLQDLLGAPATEVDRLAVHLAEEQRGGAWRSIVFLPPEATEPAEIRDRFADELLRRSASGGGEAEAGETARATTAASAVPPGSAANAHRMVPPNGAVDMRQTEHTTGPARDARSERARSPFRIIHAETKSPRAADVPQRHAQRRDTNSEHADGVHASVALAASHGGATHAATDRPQPDARVVRDAVDVMEERRGSGDAATSGATVGAHRASGRESSSLQAMQPGTGPIATAQVDDREPARDVSRHVEIPRFPVAGGGHAAPLQTDDALPRPFTAPLVIRGTHEIRELHDAGESHEIREVRDVRGTNEIREAHDVRETRESHELRELELRELREIRGTHGMRETGGPQPVAARPSISSRPRTQGSDPAFAVSARGADAAFAVQPQPTADFDPVEEPGALRLSSPMSALPAPALWPSSPAAAEEVLMFDVARELAAMLDDEADLRGVDR